MTTTSRSFTQVLWDFFCSLKLSIFLLIILASTSIIGTIIPQNPPAEYLQQLSPAKIKVYSTLGFFDMYHSWWFLLLLYLLTVNLVACSIKRLPRVWKMVTEPTLVMDAGFEKSLSLTHDFKMEGDQATVRDRLTRFLSSEFATPTVTEKDGSVHLFAQKHAYSRLGVYVVHFSIIIVFIGAMIGSFFGYKAFVNIGEGMSTSTVYTRNNKSINLGFGIKCEKFTVSFYDTGAPKEFKSILTILENGKPVPGYTNIPTIVNRPLSYKGITFYQSSYGQSTEGSTFYLTARDRKGGAPVNLTVRQGEAARLPGGRTLEVIDSTEDVRPFIPQLSGPAVRVKVSAPGKPADTFIVFRNYPQLDAERGGALIFNYTGSDEKYFTGLQVAKDPGVWVVWLGCALMVAGTCMAFFLSHKRVWIRIGEGGRVTLGGTANKNPAGFQLQFDSLVDKLKKL